MQALTAEIASVRQDRWLFAFVVWIPLLLSLFLLLIFSAGKPSDLPIGVVDLDKSSLSRKLTRYLDASPVLTVTRRYPSINVGKDDISSADIYALVVIPAGLSRDVLRGESPEVSAFFNAQYLLVAKAIHSELIKIESTIAIELDVGRTLVSIPVMQAALATSLPLRTQITALYNSNMNYATFLIPPLLLAMFQLVIICATILSLGKKRKAAKRSSPADLARQLAGRSIMYTGLFSVHILVSIVFMYGVLGWPHQASLVSLLPLVFLFVIACQLLGGFFYTLTFSPEKSLSLAGAFSAPAFAFLGVTFPASAMSGFAQFWHDLMPAAHFMNGFMNQVSYSAGLAHSLKPGLFMLAFCVLIPVIVYRFSDNQSPAV